MPAQLTDVQRTDVSRLLDAVADLRVVVVGDPILDTYLHGVSTALSREAPVPVVRLAERSEAPGGAANAAANLAALGAQVRLIGVVGRDEPGARLLALAARQGVDVGSVIASAERATVLKQRVMAHGQMLVRVDEGTLDPLSATLEAELCGLLADRGAPVDAVVVADYAAGVMTDRAIATLARRCRHGAPPLVVDAKDPRRYRAAHPRACTPSFHEAVAALGGGALAAEGAERARVGDALAAEGAQRARTIADAGPRLLDLSGAELVAVTLDRDGAVLLERGRGPHRVYAQAVHARCCAGAGDTFTAAFALGLAAGADPAAAAEVAAAAGAVAVTKAGTATCSPAELRLRLLPGGKLAPDAARLAMEAERHRREGRRIVFTNGCFDILHRGHVELLNRAKALGDVLVVAINGDASVRRLKGPERPINSLGDRVEVLAALSCVDHLVAFDEDRPEELLRALRPDVVVKGGDYRPETLPEAPLVRALGAELRILDVVPEHSTTRIVERLRLVPPSPPSSTAARAWTSTS